MPSQKLCEPTSTARGASRNCCISWRLEPWPCTSTSIASPRASNSARNVGADRLQRRAASSSARRSARRARARSAPPAAPRRRMARLVRLRESARHEDARVRSGSRTGCRGAATRASSRPAGSVNQLRRSSSPSVAEVKIQAFGALRHLLAQRLADVERRLDQPRLLRRARRSSARGRRRRARRKRARELGEAARALVQADEIGRDLAHRVERGRGACASRRRRASARRGSRRAPRARPSAA